MLQRLDGGSGHPKHKIVLVRDCRLAVESTLALAAQVVRY